MSFRSRNKVVPLMVLYGLLIGSILPVSAMVTVDNGPYDIFEKLTINVPGEQQYVPGEILVKFKPGVSEEKIKSINAAHGTQVTYTSPYAGFKKLDIPKTKTVEEMVEIYGRNPNVEYASPNAIAHAFMVPNDPGYKYYQWNFQNGTGGIDLEPAWDKYDGTGVIVAVLDTGVAYNAPDLVNTNFVQGYNFVTPGNDPIDGDSHGTHVIGTIAQSTNNIYGVAGVAYNCTIMPVKVLNDEGSGTLAWIIDGISFATDNGADIISMSLGFRSGYYPGEALDVELEDAYINGVTIVAAAGNDGKKVVSYPAAYHRCIAVGATNIDGVRTYYSNYGSALDIMAPGGELFRTTDGSIVGYGIVQNTFNPENGIFDFYSFQGTSMATPHVSGVAALLISAGASGPDEVRAAIESTAKDLGKIEGWESGYGWGLVNATAALEYITEGSGSNIPPVADAGGSYSGKVGQAITFDGSGSDDPDGSIDSYEWDFGDGSTGSGIAPEHTYYTAKTYDVVLTVTDDGGETDTDSTTVNVVAANSGTSLLHIESVEVTLNTPRKAGNNIFVSATAVVKILDDTDIPVEDAMISGLWSGATAETDTALTNKSGFATVSSAEVKNPSGSLIFNFTVNNVTHSLYTWDGISLGNETTYTPS